MVTRRCDDPHATVTGRNAILGLVIETLSQLRGFATLNTATLRNVRCLLVVVLLLLTSSAFAGDDLTAIQDNSFLVEEAYNQERGVVQHISFFSRDPRSHAWLYTLTQEWPAPSQKNQLSYTIPIARDGSRGLGDVLLNYRYQLAGSGDTRLAIAPRLSLILPTGSESKGLGRGHHGVQAAVPVSLVLGPRLVSHSDAGVTVYNGGGDPDLALGQSFIYALNSRVHLMTEFVWTQTHLRAGTETAVVVSPGLRWAYNLDSGLQIVPGVAWSFGVGPSAGDRFVIAYLSFEHSFVSK